MKDVYIAGIGRTPVTRGEAQTPAALAAAAVKESISDAQIARQDIDALFVGNMTSGILSGQLQLGALVAEQSALPGLEALTVEAACASGSAAMRMGYMAVAGGMHRAVVVCGTEKLTHVDKQAATNALATAADYDLESSRNETFVTLNATLMRLYLERYKLTEDQLAGFAITAHENAVSNPHALFHKRISQEDYSASRLVVDPLRLYDISPICDGAAAVVLVNADLAHEVTRGRTQVKVSGSAAATMPMALANRTEPLDLAAVRESSQAALRQAGIDRNRIGLLELHDAYTIMTALSLEASGYAAAGEGWRLADSERTGLHGELPIATFGGLKARGHPVGATGVYQIAEAHLQLRGDAGANQVRDLEFAMTQNIGGTAATVVSHILQRVG